MEMMLFSINPAFDLLPASEDMNTYFAEEYDQALGGIDKERAELYRLCEKNDVGLTVMKGFAGGRLFDAKRSPFGVALTPVQCIHYALTRPAVASILAGYDTPEHVDEAVSYETATEAEKDYASVLASAPRHAYDGQCTYCGHCKPCPAGIDIAMVNKLYDLASMQPEVPASVRAHYEALERTAADCTGCRGCEILFSCSDYAGRITRRNLDHASFQEFEESLGVFLFLFGRFGEYAGDLFEALFFGYACEKYVTVPCLRLPGERFQQVLFGFRAFDTFSHFFKLL